MCLTKITKDYADNDVEGIGYKVFIISGQTIRSPIFGFQKFEYNQWYSRYLYIAFITDTITYDSGFHIFKNKKDALSYKEPDEKVVRVQYKGIICSGMQADFGNYFNCLVVKQIKVLK